jgi:hypothetical protein
MQSSLIGKIEKAKRYAQETDRITFSEFKVNFHGEHNDYVTSLKDGKWQCTCSFFETWKMCSHTMAMERILGTMLPKEVQSNPYVTSAP